MDPAPELSLEPRGGCCFTVASTALQSKPSVLDERVALRRLSHVLAVQVFASLFRKVQRGIGSVNGAGSRRYLGNQWLQVQHQYRFNPGSEVWLRSLQTFEFRANSST